jgi:hypothetical protein
MKWIKWIIIILSIAFVGYLSIQFHFWAEEYKSLFFYMDDWASWIFVFLLIFALKGIFEHLLKWEVKALK